MTIWIAVAIAACLLTGCGLALWSQLRWQRDEIGDDAVTVCRHCDGDTSFWCECQGECGRRYCPWTETGMDLAVLADDGAFEQAYADLLAEVEGEL